MKRADASLARGVESLGLSLDEQQLGALSAFEALLRDRALDLGFVAASDVVRLRGRHVLDSLRAAAVVLESDGEAYDVGSGAGLPGIPVAIACPRLTVRLVEPRRSRVAFLELAVERLGLGNIEVIPSRIESIDGVADVCFTRAFAAAEPAWRAVRPRLRPRGRLVYFAGANAEVPERPAGCSALEVVPAPNAFPIETAGPLVIMTR